MKQNNLVALFAQANKASHQAQGKDAHSYKLELPSKRLPCPEEMAHQTHLTLTKAKHF